MSELLANELVPDFTKLQPDPALIETTKSMMNVVLQLVTRDETDPLHDADTDILEVLHGTQEFFLYWDAWQERMTIASCIHALNSGIEGKFDSFVQLEMMLGATGRQPNVDIFHTDMTNADFLPNSADTTAIRESHRITEQVFTIRGDKRTLAFMIFTDGRLNTDVKRSIFALTDSNTSELVDLKNPSALRGYKLYPGNISDGEYIFGSQGQSPTDLAGNEWDNWRQAMPWRFVDLTNTFHRAPADTSQRNLLLRLNVYAAPAIDPEKPMSVRVPIFKHYPN